MLAAHVRSALRPLRPRVPRRATCSSARARRARRCSSSSRGVVQISKAIGGEERPLATLGPRRVPRRDGHPQRQAAHRDRDRARGRACLVIDGQDAGADDARTARDRAAPRQEARASGSTRPTRWSRSCCNPDPKARVMLGLKRHAEAFGEETEPGMRVRTTRRRDLASEVGVDESQVATTCSRACAASASRREDATGRHRSSSPTSAAPARVPRVPRDAPEVRGVG